MQVNAAGPERRRGRAGAVPPQGRLTLAVLPLMLIGLASCGAGETGTSAAVSTGASQASPEANGKVVTIRVDGRTVTPTPGTLDLTVGQRLTLVIYSDVPNEVHVHGIEVKSQLKAGESTPLMLTARDRGTFEVETHDPQLLLTKIVVQ